VPGPYRYSPTYVRATSTVTHVNNGTQDPTNRNKRHPKNGAAIGVETV